MHPSIPSGSWDVTSPSSVYGSITPSPGSRSMLHGGTSWRGRNRMITLVSCNNGARTPLDQRENSHAFEMSSWWWSRACVQAIVGLLILLYPLDTRTIYYPTARAHIESFEHLCDLQYPQYIRVKEDVGFYNWGGIPLDQSVDPHRGSSHGTSMQGGSSKGMLSPASSHTDYLKTQNRAEPFTVWVMLYILSRAPLGNLVWDYLVMKFSLMALKLVKQSTTARSMSPVTFEGMGWFKQVDSQFLSRIMQKKTC
jgi:hypothetical protein